MATAKKTAHETEEALDALTAAVSPEAFRKNYEKFAKGLNDLADFQRKSFEAVVASTGSLAKGAEKAAADSAAFARASYDETVAAAKAAATAKSVQDAFEVQSDYVRAAFEKNLGQFNKLTDHWIATSKEAAEPITARYGEFVEWVQSYRP